MTNLQHTTSEAIDIYVIMGVSGCGKSTVAAQLATQQSHLFIEGDDYHPTTNIEKMRQGIPLTDADRAQWLYVLCQHINQQRALGYRVVVSCSALKKVYRDTLRKCHGNVQFIHLAGSKATILNRLKKRQAHFMPASLLDSQFTTLELFADEKDILTLNIEHDLPAVFNELNLKFAPTRIDL